MKKAGIICEYNPFHLGHARQLQVIRQALGEDAAIICAMSGNYVQRGEPAMWDKFSRAEAAIASGCDLVLEIPVTKVLQSAEGFAACGVEILTGFGIDFLSFGAECGNGAALMALAERLDDPDVTSALREGLSQGLSYAAARQAALHDTSNILSAPNNILGLEYCRALLRRNSTAELLVIQRTGDYHAAIPDPQAPSATAVRQQFPCGAWRSFVPEAAADILGHVPWYKLCWGERAILARLRSLSDHDWQCCAHGSEGLWRKAMKASRSEASLEAVIQAIKSKRYPRTRIQRLLLCAYLGITQEQLSVPISYVRILAISPRGRALLRQAKERCPFSLINPGQAPEDSTHYALETRAADLFTLFASPDYPMACKTEQKARIKIF